MRRMKSCHLPDMDGTVDISEKNQAHNDKYHVFSLMGEN
jgi:hypothetical protein